MCIFFITSCSNQNSVEIFDYQFIDVTIFGYKYPECELVIKKKQINKLEYIMDSKISGHSISYSFYLISEKEGIDLPSEVLFLYNNNNYTGVKINTIAGCYNHDNYTYCGESSLFCRMRKFDLKLFKLFKFYSCYSEKCAFFIKDENVYFYDLHNMNYIKRKLNEIKLKNGIYNKDALFVYNLIFENEMISFNNHNAADYFIDKEMVNIILNQKKIILNKYRNHIIDLSCDYNNEFCFILFSDNQCIDTLRRVILPTKSTRPDLLFIVDIKGKVVHSQNIVSDKKFGKIHYSSGIDYLALSTCPTPSFLKIFKLKWK